MEAINGWFRSKQNSTVKNTELHISAPLNGSFEKLKENETRTGHSKPHGKIATATTSFTPQSRGKEETLAWLNGTSDALTQLIDQQSHAASQVRRGPKTRGNREVQLILREPCPKTVEKLHRVKNQAEIAVRYGVPGTVVYNFSKSLNWNNTTTPQLPSLQLRDFGSMIRDAVAARIPPAPSTPITWLVIPDSGTSIEAAVWRDEQSVDITERPDDRRSFSQGDADGEKQKEDRRLPPLDTNVAEDEMDPYDDSPIEDETFAGKVEDQWEAREQQVQTHLAQAVTIKSVPARKAREVTVKGRRQRPVQRMTPVPEVSSPSPV
ncbi:Uu.00g048910.m01.CDS01 [Anthostomella pinea]|uniref:Uu.00g048910.m01.CDS01 n=1 Tax=Anthostomella pinea TaxID=933095 RepID=A0AAI8YEV7_9PEZI|nr:Uu.00g048910.m01.CDS01 [Anthostomella pinea]